MRIIIDHIINCLNDYINRNDQLFEKTFQELQNDKKENIKCYLKYISRIISDHYELANNDFNVFHFHFEDEVEDYIKQAIAEFLIIYHFHKFIELAPESKENDFSISDKKTTLKGLQKRLATCPDGASGKNGGNKIFKNWILEKTRANSLLKFFDRFEDSKILSPKVLFNCHIKVQNEISESLINNPYAIAISDKEQLDSFVIINTETLDSLRAIKNNGQYLLKLIKTIILFDSENRVKRFGDFNAERIINLNTNHATLFNQLIIFSFGRKGGSFDDIRQKIELVKNRFKLPDNSAYTALSSEHTFLKGNGIKNEILVNFRGIERSTFWDSFIREASVRELYELRSIKMLNIYSLAFNIDIKEYILNDIFSEKSKSHLLSEETKLIIRQLTIEDRQILYQTLSNTLDLIVKDNWLSIILSAIKYNSEILVSQEVINDSELNFKVKQALCFTNENQFKSWQNLNTLTKRPVLILAYRDQGKYPYYFNQNILETYFENSYSVTAEFLTCFFYIHYQWAKYNFAKNIQKYLDHPIRRVYFKWKELKRKIAELKPEFTNNTVWELENDYIVNDNRETIRLKFKASHKAKIYYASDLFIVKYNNGLKYRVEKLNDLANIDLNEEIIAVQSLDEIQESINIYEKIVDRDHQDRELKLICDQFNLSEVDPTTLWKILLREKVISKTEREIYDDLSQFLKNKNLRIVSFFHFKSNWLNPKSESFSPLSKKVFVSLCEYLKIPKVYYVIMLSIKNASKQASRQSTRQMNYLLKDLFNDGCFDDLTQAKDLLENKSRYYKTYHPADELGTTNDRLIDVLLTLVELISPELKLQDIESLQKIEYENS